MTLPILPGRALCLAGTVVLCMFGCDSSDRSRPAVVAPDSDSGGLRISMVFAGPKLAQKTSASILDSGVAVLYDSLGAELVRKALVIEEDRFNASFTGLLPGLVTLDVGFYQVDTLRWLAVSDPIRIEPGQIADAQVVAHRTVTGIHGAEQISPGFTHHLNWSEIPSISMYELERAEGLAFRQTDTVYRGPDTLAQFVYGADSDSIYYRVRGQHDLGDGVWSPAFHVEVLQPLLSLSESVHLVQGAQSELNLTNDGQGLLTWSLEEAPAWLAAEPLLDTLSEGESATLLLTLVPDLPPGAEQGTLLFSTNGVVGGQEVEVSYEIEALAELSLLETEIHISATETSALLLVGNTGTGPLTVSVELSDDWLSVEPSGSVEVAPGEGFEFTIEVTRACLDPGDLSASLQVVSDVGTRRITLLTEVADQPLLSISREQRRIQLGGAVKESILLLTNGGSGDLVWGIDPDELSSWLKVRPLSGSLICETDSISITAQDDGLDASIAHFDTIVVQGGGSSVEVLIELRVPEKIAVVLTPIALAFGYGDTTLSMVLQNTGTVEAAWQLTKSPTWISLSPPDGIIPLGDSVMIGVSVDRSSLSGSVVAGEIEVSYGDSLLVIPVTAEIPAPIAVLGADSVAFGLTNDAVSVSLGNQGTAPLIWSVSDLPAWASLTTTSVPISPGEEVDIVFSADRSRMTGVVGQALIEIATNDTTRLTLRLSIEKPHPIAGISPTLVTIGHRDSTGAFTLTNTGSDTLSWSVVTPSWITLRDTGGAILAGDSASLQLTPDRSDFADGEQREDSLLIVTNAPSGVLVAGILVKRNTSPVAVVVDSLAVVIGQPFELDGTQSFDADGDALGYRWFVPTQVLLIDSTIVQPTFTISSLGQFVVTLVVSDGVASSQPDEVIITVVPPNLEPLADAGSDQSGSEGDSFTFDASGSSDSDGTVVSYLWSFGDLVTSAGPAPSHVYSDNDDYEVVLTVTDDGGAQDTDTLLVVVDNVPPTAEAGGPYQGSQGEPIMFSASVSDPGVSDVHSYTWDFGDGGTAAELNAEHTYTVSGDYTATLTVTDNDGGEGTDTALVSVSSLSTPGLQLTVDLPGAVTMDMVWVDPGSFTMGSPISESSRDSDEGPQHDVTISQGFYLGKYEVTQGQWEAVMGTTPWSGLAFVQENPNHPAVKISWNDVQEFAERLNDDFGESVYRLPTEAEWEYAARAGTTTLWSFGDDESALVNHEWFSDNAIDVGEHYAHQVGTKLANPWGIHDMYGNVREWVQDWYGVAYYDSSPLADPSGPASGTSRVLRGRAFNSGATYLRPANRDANSPDHRSEDVGARLLRMTEGVPPGSTGDAEIVGEIVGAVPSGPVLAVLGTPRVTRGTFSGSRFTERSIGEVAMITGEIENTGTTTATDVRISVDLRDSGGSLLGRIRGENVGTIGPGSSEFFAVIILGVFPSTGSVSLWSLAVTVVIDE